MLPQGSAGGAGRRATSSSSSSSSSKSSSSGEADMSSSSYDSDTSSSRSASPPAESGRGVSASTPAASAAPVRVQLNPSLHFERSDNEYIPLPSVREGHQIAFTLRTLVKDRHRYPEGRYRRLDYLRAALEMFVAQVRLEFQQQNQSAQRANRANWRFTWKNKGELAICFACCCDMLKLLYDVIQPSPLKPSWESIVPQMTLLMISESRVPTAILSEQTYHTKYLDWQKGGTRYGGDQNVSNVRFPSAHERKVKIETYLRSGAGYTIQAITVDSQAAAAQRAARPAASAVAVAPTATPSLPVPPGTRVEVKTIAPLAPAMAHVKGLEPARPPAAVSAKTAPGTAAAAPVVSALVSTKELPEEMRHLYWLAALARVKGGEPVAAMPDERLSAVPGLVRLSDITDTVEEMRLLLDILLASSDTVQDLFERLGGLQSIRRFVSQCVRTKDGSALVLVVERLVRLRATPWSAASQKAWRTNMESKLTADLGWLRGQACIPPARRAAWGALILVMEQKFIFRPPRDVAMAALKRQRDEALSPAGGGSSGSDTSLRSAALDNIEIPQWRESRVHIFDACRLPTALRAPPLSSALEKDTIDFLNDRKRFAEAAQDVWRQSLTDALHRNHSAALVDKIPLWYDVYQLLGVDPAAATAGK